MAPAAAAQSVSGTVQGGAGVGSGAGPVANSFVTAYQAGTSAYGSGATALASTATASNGGFSLFFDCPSTGPPSYVYLVASGGNDGNGNNSALKLMAALGPCGGSIRVGPPATVVIDEATTVASVYALAQFMDAVNPQAVGTSSANLIGLENTFGAVQNLVSLGAGTAPGGNLPAGATAPVEKLNTLANALAQCVSSAGPSATGPAPCNELFCDAAAGVYNASTGTCSLPPGAAEPSDTLKAALAIALNPGRVDVADLFTLAGKATVFSPALGAPPTDWTLALNFVGAGLSEPTSVAIDGAGNVWVANYNSAVSELSGAGLPLSPAGGFTGGGLEESFAIALDATGNVWVSNEQSPPGVNSGLGSVTKLAPDGAVLSGASGYWGGGIDFPVALSIDPAGNVWAANYGNASVTKLAPTGTALSPSGGFTGAGINFPVGLAFDSAGSLWIADQSNDNVSELTPGGAALSPSSGYTGGGLDLPQAIAVDQAGNVWVTNFYGDSVTELGPDGAALSPARGFTGGGLASPGGVAVDGGGNVWVTNYHGASISALEGRGASSPGTPLSPSSGFTGGGLGEPFNPAIDRSGNLWAANFAADSVTEFVGIAVPVTTPLIGPPQRPEPALRGRPAPLGGSSGRTP